MVSPLRHLDVVAVDTAARKETRNREVTLPPVSVYRWWARRTLAVNDALLAAVERGRPDRLLVADPFAGGGVIPLATVARGHQSYAQELNPWAAQGLATMLDLPDPERLQEAGDKLEADLADLLDRAYATNMSDGNEAKISHTFRVAAASCLHCDRRLRLFPHALVSLRRRKERGGTAAFVACAQGHVTEGVSDRPVACSECDETVDPSANYTRGRWVTCHECGQKQRMEALAVDGAWSWDVVLIERASATGREVALPTNAEIEQANSSAWQPQRQLGPIPAGQETHVLRRHGFERWEELYPARQRHVLEALLEAVNGFEPDVAAALRLAAIGTAEMAGLASRWDRWYLKSYEMMAAHRFNFTTFAAEPNVWGTSTSGRGTFSRRLRLFSKAAVWLHDNAGHLQVEGPLDSAAPRRKMGRSVDVRVVQGTSERSGLSASTVDLVLTDPPYHDDVQYGELSLPLRAWAGLPLDTLDGEAVANASTGANSQYGDYTTLLGRIFAECRRTLKADGHVIFSYANRDPRAWAALFASLQQAGLRACGYAVLHSENETDHAKRGVRACTMDFILDLVDGDRHVDQVGAPQELPSSDEGQFLEVLGGWFAQLGGLENGWEEQMVADLQRTAFLSN